MHKALPRKSTFIPMIFSALLLSSAVYSADRDLTVSLFTAIDERLAYMENVALYKAQNHLPIEDIEREESVIADAIALAASHGLKPDSMEQFFRAQINAAKAIQYRYRAELLNRETSIQVLDLQTEVRPALDQLGTEIVTLFALLMDSQISITEETRELFRASIQHRLLMEADLDALFDAMLEVRRSE